jgi:hypothetical protein
MNAEMIAQVLVKKARDWRREGRCVRERHCRSVHQKTMEYLLQTKEKERQVTTARKAAHYLGNSVVSGYPSLPSGTQSRGSQPERTSTSVNRRVESKLSHQSRLIFPLVTTP